MTLILIYFVAPLIGFCLIGAAVITGKRRA